MTRHSQADYFDEVLALCRKNDWLLVGFSPRSLTVSIDHEEVTVYGINQLFILSLLDRGLEAWRKEHPVAAPAEPS